VVVGVTIIINSTKQWLLQCHRCSTVLKPGSFSRTKVWRGSYRALRPPLVVTKTVISRGLRYTAMICPYMEHNRETEIQIDTNKHWDLLYTYFDRKRRLHVNPHDLKI
jgi:hypothetical protein